MSRIIILMYHIIGSPKSARELKYCCTASKFERQMRYLHANNANLISLNQIADALDGKDPWPGNGVAVTFDDGFEDTFINATPVLEKYRIPATFFIVSDRIGGTNDWMSSRGFPERRLVDRSQIDTMKTKGITIGSHTRTHPRLPELSTPRVHNEIHDSKKRLEDIVGAPVSHFAYPYGLFNETAITAVKSAGYLTACSTQSGFNRSDINRHLIRRIEVYGSDNLRQFRQKLLFGTNDGSLAYPLRYYAGRLLSRLRA